MAVAYFIGQYVGYFAFMLIFLVLAIIFAKRIAGWILFAIGAVVQLLSIIGNQKTLNMFGWGRFMMPYWLIYIVLLIIGIAIIYKRRSNTYHDYGYSNESSSTSTPKDPTEITTTVHGDGWQCPCGRNHQSYESSCVCGMTKQEARKNDQA